MLFVVRIWFDRMMTHVSVSERNYYCSNYCCTRVLLLLSIRSNLITHNLSTRTTVDMIPYVPVGCPGGLLMGNFEHY